MKIHAGHEVNGSPFCNSQGRCLVISEHSFRERMILIDEDLCLRCLFNQLYQLQGGSPGLDNKGDTTSGTDRTEKAQT